MQKIDRTFKTTREDVGISRRDALRRAAGAGALLSWSSLGDLFVSGKGLGQRIVDLVPEGEVVGFTATPGQLNIQPRLDGAKAAIKEAGKNITLNEVSTGPTLNEEVSAVEAYYTGHPNIKGTFAVDAGSTAAVAKTMAGHQLQSKAPSLFSVGNSN